MDYFRLNEYVSCRPTFACINCPVIFKTISSADKGLGERSSTISKVCSRPGSRAEPVALQRTWQANGGKKPTWPSARQRRRRVQFNNATKANNESANGNAWLDCLPSFASQGRLRSFHGASFGNRAEQNVEYGRPLVWPSPAVGAGCRRRRAARRRAARTGSPRTTTRLPSGRRIFHPKNISHLKNIF